MKWKLQKHTLEYVQGGILAKLRFSDKLEWGCPNGTKYPPRQPIQTPQVMCLKPFYLTARFYLIAGVYRQTDGRTGWFQYTPPNFVAGGKMMINSTTFYTLLDIPLTIFSKFFFSFPLSVGTEWSASIIGIQRWRADWKLHTDVWRIWGRFLRLWFGEFPIRVSTCLLCHELAFCCRFLHLWFVEIPTRKSVLFCELIYCRKYACNQ